jgi:hypothetical protein
MTEQQFRHWAASHLAAIERSADAAPVNVLVLSGGGGAGAFGAGVLSGWGRLGARPRCQIVTGVSVVNWPPLTDPQIHRLNELLGGHNGTAESSSI